MKNPDYANPAWLRGELLRKRQTLADYRKLSADTISKLEEDVKHAAALYGATVSANLHVPTLLSSLRYIELRCPQNYSSHVNGWPDRKCVEDAIDWFAGTPTAEDLSTHYYGIKEYSGYRQRSDHTYGFGPSHGHIVFSVGLQRIVREEIASSPTIAPVAQINHSIRNACIYFLEAFKEGKIPMDVIQLWKPNRALGGEKELREATQPSTSIAGKLSVEGGEQSDAEL